MFFWGLFCPIDTTMNLVLKIAVCWNIPKSEKMLSFILVYIVTNTYTFYIYSTYLVPLLSILYMQWYGHVPDQENLLLKYQKFCELTDLTLVAWPHVSRKLAIATKHPYRPDWILNIYDHTIVCTNSVYSPSDSIKWRPLSFPLYRWRNWGQGRWSHLSMVT